MDVRAQIASVFHLDKCIGCHTCSLACKNLWTSREGTEYMWWNNVETKPGTGFPTRWEDQETYKGGWEVKGNNLVPRTGGRMGILSSMFYNPNLPTMDDYYEPFTYDYDHLFTAPPGDAPPTARPMSRITGKYMEIEAGPNWDDDLSGSPVYARNDPNLVAMTAAEREALFKIEQMVFFYIPRICNHCLNPACAAVCPSGAIYKRGEDGIVLVSQEKCRGWRFCVSGCPYKKTYYNWQAGKSEKCILCYPRLETGQAPACFHTCVGRIRYSGVLLYDAEGIEAAAKAPDADLVAAQRKLFLDPNDPAVAAAARQSGISDAWLAAARKSPVYRFVKEWELALPLHPEFRTLPTLFYVPPLLPVVASSETGAYAISETGFFGSSGTTRAPLAYLARLFAGGNAKLVERALEKLWAVRGLAQSKAAGLSSETAGQIAALTALPRFADRFVIPPYQREVDIEQSVVPQLHKAQVGFGTVRPPRRGP